MNIQADWDVSEIGEVALLGSGTTPSRKKERDYFVGGSIPWVKTGDLNNSYVAKTEESITQQALNECALRIYPPGTVLIAMYGGFNQIGRTGLLRIPATTNQAITSIQVNESVMKPEFLQLWLNFKVKQWRRIAGSSRKDPNISKKDIARFLVPTPSIDTQIAIIKFLDKWDLSINILQKMIGLKRNHERGLKRNLLMGKTRFSSFDNDGFKQEIQIGQVPLDWRILKIQNIAEEISERSAPEGTPVLSCTKYDGLVPSLEYFGRQVFGNNLDNYKVVKRNQFAYATNHIEEGSIGLLRNSDAGLVSPMYTVFGLTTETVDPEFLFAILKTETYRRLFEALTHASVNRRGSLRWPVFSKIVVAIPTLPEQQKIMSVLNAADREIELLEKQLRLLKLQKRGLMQKLLTGDIQISTLDDAA